MKKITLMTLLMTLLMMFSVNSLACGSGVDMYIPHIHDEADLLISIEQTKQSKLKRMDIYQIFNSKTESKLDHQHDEKSVSDRAVHQKNKAG